MRKGSIFFDVAELYPVPPTTELAGESEKIVGRWLKTKPRDGVIIATKLGGDGPQAMVRWQSEERTSTPLWERRGGAGDEEGGIDL